MKTLSDVKKDMSELYDECRSGSIDLKLASELANIAGKYLKAEQLELAKEIFQKDIGAHPALSAPNPKSRRANDHHMS